MGTVNWVFGVAGLIVIAGIGSAACSNEAEDCERALTCDHYATGGNGPTSTSTGPVTEDCLNGIDDDEDGAADCNDDDCQAGYQCVPVVPGAPVVILSATCEAGMTDAGLSDCTACACTPQQGACQVQGTVAGNSNCDGQTFSFSTLPGECEIVQFTAINNAYVNITNSIPANPSIAMCTAADLNVPACKLDSSGLCGSTDQTCVPKSASACVLLTDGENCPADYPTQRSVREGGNCGCECSVIETCPVAVALYDDTACTMNETPFPSNLNVCTDSGRSTIVALTAPASAVSCTKTENPSGGTLKTLCCQM